LEGRERKKKMGKKMINLKKCQTNHNHHSSHHYHSCHGCNLHHCNGNHLRHYHNHLGHPVDSQIVHVGHLDDLWTQSAAVAIALCCILDDWDNGFLVPS
jgi:hypothetical protein